MPFHCLICDKPIVGHFGFKSICIGCKKKESAKERKTGKYYKLYNIYNIYIYNIKYSINKLMSRLLWQNH
jgi:hypothetical protein